MKSSPPRTPVSIFILMILGLLDLHFPLYGLILWMTCPPVLPSSRETLALIFLTILCRQKVLDLSISPKSLASRKIKADEHQPPRRISRTGKNPLKRGMDELGQILMSFHRHLSLSIDFRHSEVFIPTRNSYFSMYRPERNEAAPGDISRMKSLYFLRELKNPNSL